ncbi:MAG: hypothetical protein PHH91_02435 [Desulfuromonadaceae bacterium]|nr:hypothetical protein [Desulfuromonadaceae bacterium]
MSRLHLAMESYPRGGIYGDTIVARTARAEYAGCYIHCIENGSDGRELTRLRTRWIPLARTFY